MRYTNSRLLYFTLSFGPNAVSNKKTPVTIAYFDRPVVQSPIRMDCKLYDTLQADNIYYKDC